MRGQVMCATKDAANVPAGGLGPVAAAVEMYPEPLLAHPSQTHQVRVLGAPVFVERYAGVGYARFAMGGSVAVEIEVASPITHFTIFPTERVAAARAVGTVPDLRSPRHVQRGGVDRPTRAALRSARSNRRRRACPRRARRSRCDRLRGRPRRSIGGDDRAAGRYRPRHAPPGRRHGGASAGRVPQRDAAAEEQCLPLPRAPVRCSQVQAIRATTRSIRDGMRAPATRASRQTCATSGGR